MRKRILVIVLVLMVPAALYLGWVFYRDMWAVKAQTSLHVLEKNMLARAPVHQSLFDVIMSKIDRIGTSVSLFLGILVALKELHTTKKAKRKSRKEGL